MIITEQTMTIRINKDDSKILTSAINCLIEWKKNNHCTEQDCEDCKREGNDIREKDKKKLAEEILDLYFMMYKLSMSTTKIPTIMEIENEII